MGGLRGKLCKLDPAGIAPRSDGFVNGFILVVIPEAATFGLCQLVAGTDLLEIISGNL